MRCREPCGEAAPPNAAAPPPPGWSRPRAASATLTSNWTSLGSKRTGSARASRASSPRRKWKGLREQASIAETWAQPGAVAVSLRGASSGMSCGASSSSTENASRHSGVYEI